MIDASKLNEALGMEEALVALEEAFGGAQALDGPQRMHVGVPGGDLLLMPGTDGEVSGVKLVTVAPSNPENGLPLIQGVYVLFSGSLEPVAVIDGAELTRLRTAAVSALATSYLAREGARKLVLFGAGVQARAHLEAMRLVRPIGSVTVVDRSPERAARIAEHARGTGLEAEVAGPEAVAGADIVCTCTTSNEPVFDGSLLPAGAHVNAIGAFKPDARELDDETVRKGRLVVETREAALAEAGDLVIPMGRGVIGPSAIRADLAELVAGKAVRTGPEDVTVFKSVGHAFEDLVVAAAAFERVTGRARRPQGAEQKAAGARA
jgi:ornithine cyclodeaminase